jgi:acyl-CoA synthetase (AMP-forming)/AMP-acid ligase II
MELTMDELKTLTVGQVLEKSAAESPDKVAVVDGERRITYSELNNTANALAAGLAESGSHLYEKFGRTHDGVLCAAKAGRHRGMDKLSVPQERSGIYP